MIRCITICGTFHIVSLLGDYEKVTLYQLAKRLTEQIGETEGIAYSLLGIGVEE